MRVLEFVVIGFLFTYVSESDANNISESIQVKLFDYIIANYYAHPSFHNATELNIVYFDLLPHEIVHLSTREQVMSLFCWNRMWWFDDRLYWDPNDFDNVSTIEIAPDLIWMPNLISDNNLEMDQVKSERSMPLVLKSVILPSGRPAALVRRLTPQIYKLQCVDHVRQFPFDYVTCQFTYSSWNGLNLSVLDGVKQNYFQDDLEWWYINFTVNYEFKTDITQDDENSRAYLIFKLIIRRKAMFYVYSMLVPACLSVQLSFFAMFLAADTTGDRMETVNLGFISILGLSFLLIKVGDDTPKASEPQPDINQLLLRLMLAVNMAIVSSLGMIYLQVYANSGVPVPFWLSKIFCLHTKKVTFQSEESFANDLMPKGVKGVRVKNTKREVVKNAHKIIRILLDAKRLFREDETSAQNMKNWQKVIRRIEMLLLAVFSSWHCFEQCFFLYRTLYRQF